MAQIVARSLSRAFASEAGPVTALQGIDLSLEKGDFLAVMGPSGSGKTTLMNLIGLLDTPTSGKLLLNGVDSSTLSDRERATLRNRSIGFVFQSYNLLARWNALENVELPLVYAGVQQKERTRRAQQMLDAVGLNNRMTHLPSQLSGGEQQRVALARAMVNSPDLVLADEPTGALDSNSGKQVLEMLNSFNRSGTSIILVTHDRNVAASAQRLVEMIDGGIAQSLNSSDANTPMESSGVFTRSNRAQ